MYSSISCPCLSLIFLLDRLAPLFYHRPGLRPAPNLDLAPPRQLYGERAGKKCNEKSTTNFEKMEKTALTPNL